MAGDAIRVLTASGVVFLDVRDPDERSALGEYWNAVRAYLSTGDDSRLRDLEGEVVVAHVPLETDLDVIDEMARRGELDFPDIYES